MPNILDKNFRYLPAAEQTVEALRRRFAQERKRLADLKREQEADAANAALVVSPIRKRK